MDEKVAFTVAKLIEAGIVGKSEVVASYATQLVDHFKGAGEADIAALFSSSAKKRNGKKASIKRAMPVDIESRIPVADELIIEEPIDVVLDENVQAVVDRWLDCINNAARLAKYGLAAPASLLMHGPPGCGKTLLAKSIAEKLNLPLLTARSDSLISSYLGSTSKNVRALFEHATSRPCVLFLDEFDAIAKMRDDQRELGELKRVVISLLQNIDASGNDHFLLAATNHAHLLDKAVWRRFAYTIEIGLPDSNARKKLLQSFLSSFAESDVVELLSMITEGLSGAQIKCISEDAIRTAVISGSNKIELAASISMATEMNQENGALSQEDTIRKIRQRLGKKVPQARLADIFGLSQSTVSRILKNE